MQLCHKLEHMKIASNDAAAAYRACKTAMSVVHRAQHSHFAALLICLLLKYTAWATAAVNQLDCTLLKPKDQARDSALPRPEPNDDRARDSDSMQSNSAITIWPTAQLRYPATGKLSCNNYRHDTPR
eukprot:18497-Heterococcus_DN1.PRE.2